MLAELLGMGFPSSLCEQAVRKEDLATIEMKVDWVCCQMQAENSDVKDVASRSAELSDEDAAMYDFKMVFAVRMDLKMKPGKVAAQCVHAALGAVRNSTQWEQFIEFVREMEERRAEVASFEAGGTAVGSSSGGVTAADGASPVMADGSEAVSKPDSSASDSGSDDSTPFVSKYSHEQLRALFERLRSNVSIWEATGEKAVCLKCPTEEAMELLIDRCCVAEGPNGGIIPWHYVVDAGRTQIEAGSMTVLAIGPQSNDTINQLTGDLKLY